MTEPWLWPFKGGTTREKLWALVEVLEILLTALAFYWLCWALAS